MPHLAMSLLGMAFNRQAVLTIYDSCAALSSRAPGSQRLNEPGIDAYRVVVRRRRSPGIDHVPRGSKLPGPIPFMFS